MIFVNFKTYPEGTGEQAIDLVKLLDEVAQSSQVKIIPVLQAADLKEASLISKLEIWSQKVDALSAGAHTGAILAEAVVEDGASGTFLNHSEAKFGSFDELAGAKARADEVGLKTLIFAGDLKELAEVLTLKPTFSAFEPPELIGSREVSVASAMPEVISKAAQLSYAAGIPLVVGAGIHSGEDVKKSLQMGAVGVAVSSDIVKASDPRTELIDLTEGFK